ncbi:hypothetical protein WH52_01380 [Tenacibaculum holothuriorum]|uniref:Uncharacterized protein n=1 Tax=Tenacibaculum holothuriorum TaxID=1635173 RepID=A0A1Y2PHX3_9FLAO|nr:hypothetical protein [Tenacibaculum holothuriorum]OSY89319.1 hypothetical protein WH52_01380 [Tenacibaculum holothuriorum]
MWKFLKGNIFLMLGIFIIVLLLLESFKNWVLVLFSEGKSFSSLDSSDSVISDVQARSIAEQLHKAMGTVWGTDEETIFNIFSTISVADFKKVYNAFGHRPYFEPFGVPTLKIVGENIDLFGWLSYELTNEEMVKLKGIAPAIFSLNT